MAFSEVKKMQDYIGVIIDYRNIVTDILTFSVDTDLPFEEAAQRFAQVYCDSLTDEFVLTKAEHNNPVRYFYHLQKEVWVNKE